MNFSFKLCLVEKISVSPEKSQSSLCFGVQQYHYRGMPDDLRLRSEKLSPKPSPYCSWHSNPKLASQSFSNLDSSSVIKDDLSWSPCFGNVNQFVHSFCSAGSWRADGRNRDTNDSCSNMKHPIPRFIRVADKENIILKDQQTSLSWGLQLPDISYAISHVRCWLTSYGEETIS